MIAFILLMVSGVAFFLWKWKKPSQTYRSGLQVMSQHPLGMGTKLVIVEVAGQSLLLGVTQNQISIIQTLSPADGETRAQASSDKPHQEATLALPVSPSPFEIKNEEDSFNRVRDAISNKLKGMRPL